MATKSRALLQVYIFQKLPQNMPPVTNLTNCHWKDLVGAIRRAAVHPWRDALFWRQAAVGVSSVPPSILPGRDLAQVCLAFRTIGFKSPRLAHFCRSYLDERRQGLNTFELSALLLYYTSISSGARDDQEFVRNIAHEACIEWRKREKVPWSAWKMLVIAVADARVASQQLFATASPHLTQGVQFMAARDAVDVCNAFATFRFKHHGLLSEVSRFAPSMGLKVQDVHDLTNAFNKLEFEHPPLFSHIRELREEATP